MITIKEIFQLIDADKDTFIKNMLMHIDKTSFNNDVLVCFDNKKELENYLPLTVPFVHYSMDNETYRPLIFNPLVVPLEIPVPVWLHFITDVYQDTFEISNLEKRILLETIYDIYEKYGVIEAKDEYEKYRNSKQATFKEVSDSLIKKSEDVNDVLKINILSLLYSMIELNLTNSHVSEFYSNDKAIGLNDLFKPNSYYLFETSGSTSTFTKFVKNLIIKSFTLVSLGFSVMIFDNTTKQYEMIECKSSENSTNETEDDNIQSEKIIRFQNKKDEDNSTWDDVFLELPDFDDENDFLSKAKIKEISQQERNQIRERVKKHNFNNQNIPDFTDYEEMENDIVSLTKNEKNVLSLLGSTGISRYKNIENSLMDLYGYKHSRIREYLMNLVNKDLVIKENVHTPISKISIYYLSDNGKELYKTLFPDNKLTKSEAEKIIDEFGSFSHGYGIKYIAKVLKNNHSVSNVSIQNRSNPISVSDDDYYTPDIICKISNHTIYIEYETGEKSSLLFYTLLDKLYDLKQNIYIVAINKKIMEELIKKAEKWIQKNKVKDVSIHFSTVAKLKEIDNLLNKNEWEFYLN